MKVILKFAINQLIFDGTDSFSLETFSTLKETDIDRHEHQYGDSEKETISIMYIQKIIKNNRFITLYFRYGDKYPYSNKVINTSSSDLTEKDNPRPIEDIEPDKQFFALIDINTQRIYVSEQRKKYIVSDYLRTRLDLNVVIKSIILEQEFIANIKSIDKIAFSIEPNLFNTKSEDDLTKHLANDIYAYGADRAQITLEYNQTHITTAIADRIKAIIARKSEFKDIVIVGRDEKAFENIFNLEEISRKIPIEVNVKKKSDLLKETEVFDSIIEKITKL